MEIVVKRVEYSTTYTIGKLYINKVFQCWTLEDKVREHGIKIPNKTAIPEGTYKVIINYSNKFKKQLPLLLDVPLFEGIRIHSGNKSKDTEGCILVGTVWTGGDWIGESKKAFNNLFTLIQDSIKNNNSVTIKIINT